MTRGAPLLAGAAAVLLCILLAGCGRCGGDPRGSIATLTAADGGSVSRDYADRLHVWEPAEVGTRLSLGDGVRTDVHSTAELTFVNGSTLALDRDTIVRLLPELDGRGETAFDVETGRARLKVGASGLSLRTHVGVATIAPESDVTLTRSGAALGFDVALGEVRFREHDAGIVHIGPGDSVNVGIGMAVLSLSRGAPASDAGLPPVADGGFRVVIERGSLRVSEDGRARTLGRGTHELAGGAELRTAPGSSVQVVRGPGSAELRGAGEYVLGPPGALLESRRGTAVLEADGAEVGLRVPEGVLVARGDVSPTRAVVGIAPLQGKISVERGSVRASLGEQTEELAAGEQHTWGRGAAAPPRPGPAYRNMLTRAGDSFVVHTPSAPVAVGFGFEGKCPGEGVLELIGGRQVARGKGSANLSFPAGTRAYTLRCIDARGAPGKVRARGTVQVIVDSGTRKLPPRAPTSHVEADGRSYTVYYQNQLPEIVVRWPNPPAQGEFALEIDGKTIPVDGPEHRFRSGSLRDGAHKLSFRAQGRRSRTTTVVVRFDNAAPKASLGAPAERGFSPGDVVEVQGVALPGWRVAIVGGSVEQEAGDRFSGSVQTSKDRPDIAVRLSHPRLGTHYYLRRASASP